MASKRRRHRNPNGHWCNCPWGQRQLNDPIDDLWEVEKYGSKKVAWLKESAKLDWLRGRPDMQEPHHQRFLDYLEKSHPDHDNLFPWLARERKKGRLHFKDENDDESRIARGYAIEPTINFTNHHGYHTPLDDDHLETLQDWMKYKKQAKQGVDIMQQHIGDAIDQSDKWDGMGETLHESEHYPGWTVKLLRNRRDLRKEGERMNHCLGGMNYHEDQARGDGAFYSVRDGQNDPHASLELRRAYGAEDADPRNPQGNHYHQGDYYGHGDGPVPYEAQEVMNEFMGPKGHYLEPSEHEEEEEEFEPWWDSEYSIGGPESEEDWLAHSREEYEEANLPEEYERAHRDAYDNDMEGPDLYVGDPNIEDIWNDFEWNHTRNGTDPHRVQEMFKTMDDGGYGDEWREYANNWLQENYKEYLDPYGTDPEWNPTQRDQFSDPHAPPQGPGRMQAPAIPGSYYPGRANPHDEYFARNLDYHLNANVDPETGEGMAPYQTERMYPQENAGFDPQYKDNRVPRPDAGGRGYREPNPFGPDGRAQQEIEGLPDPDPWGRRTRPIPPPRTGLPPEEEWQNSDLYKNRQEGEKRDALPHPYRGEPETWEEGGTTNWHQLPIQGLQENAPQPGHVNQYMRGEPQGRIFPKNWYVDRYSRRSGETDLPPHLFPPDRYVWHDLQPHPQQLPMWSANPAHIPAGPKWDDSIKQFDFDNQNINPTLPPEGQSWNMTQGEISPSNYVNELARNPQTSIAPGGNHPTVPWQASYHPRDDDEWVDEDEPEFTATQPEPRWGSS